MVQIKLSLASILIATAIAPAVAQPLGRREVTGSVFSRRFATRELADQLEARQQTGTTHHHVHHNGQHHHVHHNGQHHNGQHHNHHSQGSQVPSVDATQPATGADAAATPVAREYVDMLEVRQQTGTTHHHVHHNGQHHHVHHNGQHHNGQHHNHHGQGSQVPSVDATQPATGADAAATPVAREYVDMLEARQQTGTTHHHNGQHHHVHHNGQHHNGQHHHHHGQGSQVPSVDATQPAADAAATPVAREYVDMLEVRQHHIPHSSHVHHNGQHHHVHHNGQHHNHHGQGSQVPSVDATQPAADAAATPVAREYVDMLEVRQHHIPHSSHVHHNGQHHHVHHNGQHHNHHGQGSQVPSVDATQPAADAAATPVAREYVDMLEVRQQTGTTHHHNGQHHHVHHNGQHHNGQHHHHHGQGSQVPSVDATQPATSADAATPVAREYFDELFGRDFDYFSLDARDLDLD